MSVNKVILIGNLGRDPEVRQMSNGNPVANLSIATSEHWKDKTTGEQKEKTEWHRVVIFSEGLCRVAQQYLLKGSKIYLEGKLQTRKYQDQSGQEKYKTEIVLQGFDAKLVMLDGRQESQGSNAQTQQYAQPQQSAQPQQQPPMQQPASYLNDDIPF